MINYNRAFVKFPLLKYFLNSSLSACLKQTVGEHLVCSRRIRNISLPGGHKVRPYDVMQNSSISRDFAKQNRSGCKV